MTIVANPFRKFRSSSCLAFICGLAIFTAVQFYPQRASAQTAIAFVQTNSVTPAPSATSMSVPFTAAQSAGNLNIVVVGWNDITHSVVSVTDSKSNIYVPAVGPTLNSAGGGLGQTIYYAKNIPAAAAGANTVTVTFSGATFYPDVRILEYSGVDVTTPVDVTAIGTGSGVTSSTTAVTTTNANDLLFAANMVFTETTGPGAGFTNRIITTDYDIAEDRLVAALGSYSASAAMNENGLWLMQMVAFRAAGGTAPPPDTTPPTAPGTPVPTAASSTQINLTWPAATDNVGVTSYFVERCAGAGCSTFAQVATPTAAAFNDTGLSASASYSYRVRATDAAGNLSPYSATASATTLASDTTPPTAPSSLTATRASNSQINLAWTASTDNVAVTGYRVESCLGVGCSNFAQIATTTTATYADTGLAANSMYSYRVRANDAAGNLSAYSNTATGSTDALAPTAPGSLTATPASTTQINLAWTAATDAGGVAGYRVERCQGAACSTFAQIAAPTTTTFGDTGLTASTSYSYRVRAIDVAGNLGPYSATASATTSAPPDTTPPTAPGTPVPTVISSSQINLTWPAATDAVGVTGYFVESCAGAGCTTFAQVGAPVTTSFNNTGLSIGTSYSYRVRATDAAGNIGPYSATATATTTAVDTTAPTAPSALTATAASTSQVNLAWTASTDNVAVTGYRVERCQGAGCATFVQVLTPTGTSVTDAGLAGATSYSYRVRATDAAGNLSAYSGTASATTFVSTGAITFVQISAATPHSSANSVAVIYPSPQSAGNLNVVAIGWGDTANAVLSVTDSKNNAYVPAVGTTVNASGGLSHTIYYAKNITAAAAGSNTVTVTFNAAAAFPDVRILEYSGADVSAPVDVSATGTGSGATSSTTAVTTSNAADLLFAANVVATQSTAAGSGFTSRLISADGNIVEDETVTVVGSYSPTATLNSGQWVMQMVAFRTSGSPPPPPDTTPPTAPSSLTATALGTQINLSWTASTDNVAVAGYRVERCLGAGCTTFGQVATPTGTTFADTGLLTSTNYSYRVRATDAAGNLSGYSNTASATTSSAPSNPVVIENQQTGTTLWQLGDLYGRKYSTDAVGQIKGYASAVSVNKGETITFHVSTNTAQTYTIDVYRMGWYGGLGGRLMQHIGPLNGTSQPACPMNASLGMTECSWAPSYDLATQTSWTSGVYLAVLKNANNFYNYMVFTVRDDSRVAALLYQQPVTTYQAYNGWGGKNLYDPFSTGANTIAGTPRAVKVSFDRPYADDGAGTLLWLSELNFIRWAEKSGYDITYSTNLDTHLNATALLNHRGFISVPHDEYWSKPMYDGVIAARNAGVNFAFFGSNSVFWQVRFEPSSTGVANRIMACWKDATLDPNTDPTLETVEWRQSPVNRPEQAFVGVEFTDGPNSGTASYIVTNSSNWVYAGTGFKDGDVVPGIVWYEVDRVVAGDGTPAAVSGTYTLLSHSPYAGSQGSDYGNSSIYQAPSGAWVFASGTHGWGWGLDNFYPEGSVSTVDARIQKATANVLDRFGGR